MIIPLSSRNNALAASLGAIVLLAHGTARAQFLTVDEAIMHLTGNDRKIWVCEATSKVLGCFPPFVVQDKSPAFAYGYDPYVATPNNTFHTTTCNDELHTFMRNGEVSIQRYTGDAKPVRKSWSLRKEGMDIIITIGVEDYVLIFYTHDKNEYMIHRRKGERLKDYTEDRLFKYQGNQ